MWTGLIQYKGIVFNLISHKDQLAAHRKLMNPETSQVAFFINRLVILLTFRHAGLDPASRSTLDSGFRRNDGVLDNYETVNKFTGVRICHDIFHCI